MDSITHSLYKAIVAEDERQQRVALQTLDGPAPLTGLQPICRQETVWQAYAGASGTDLYIALNRSPELFALFLEFTAAGFSPPAGMVVDGAEVIISPGRIDVMAQQDGDETDAPLTSWNAILTSTEQPSKHGLKRNTAWQEQVT